MAFNTQAALQAGYSQDEINQYLQQKNSVMGGGGIGQVAHTITNAIPDWLGGGYIRSLLGAGYEGSRALGNAAGVQNLYTTPQGKTVQDPFLSQQDLQSYTTPQQGAMQTAKNVGSAESLVLPYGKGGILARLGIGALGGGAASVGESPQEAGTNIVLGAGINAISPVLGGLFGGNKAAQAGSKINQLIQQAESTPQKQKVIDSLLEKHFGTASNPNLDLIPNAPAQEIGPLKNMLKKEIMTQGRGSLGNTNFQDIQNFKQGTAARGRFDKSISTATQKLMQNMSRAYGNVMLDAIPDIAKPYGDYQKAMISQQQHGTGIPGVVAKIQSNPVTKLLEGLSTGYVGYRGLTHLLQSPFQAVSATQGWGGPQQSGNNGW